MIMLICTLGINYVTLHLGTNLIVPILSGCTFKSDYWLMVCELFIKLLSDIWRIDFRYLV